MARLTRLTISGYTHHVIHRGNNRQDIFLSDVNRRTLLDLITEGAYKYAVEIHAYVLMGNHFHLLATPSTSEGMPKMMQSIGRAYVRYFNDGNGRSGTLWEGRYKSTLIQSERYLLQCMVYMDLNPVRAGVVAQASAYPWSSHLYYVGQRQDKLLTPHPLYWSLGNTPFAREAAYAELVQSGITPEQLAALTDSALRGWALGDHEFVAELQKMTQRRVSKGQAGRPISKPKDASSSA